MLRICYIASTLTLASTLNPMTFPATFGRRFAALMIDWIVALFISNLIGPHQMGRITTARAQQIVIESAWLQTGIFALEIIMMTTLVGGSFGQLALKLRIVSTDTGGRPNILQVIVRTILILLVVPALLTKEGRGFHDIIARTRIVKIAAA